MFFMKFHLFGPFTYHFYILMFAVLCSINNVYYFGKHQHYTKHHITY